MPEQPLGLQVDELANAERIDFEGRVVDAELADLAQNGPADRELQVAKGGFEGATVLALEDPRRAAEDVVLQERVAASDVDRTRADRREMQLVVADDRSVATLPEVRDD